MTSPRMREIHPSQLIKLPDNPSVEECVKFISTSMDMVDWNNKRRLIMRTVGYSKFCNNGNPCAESYVAKIDCSNLAVETMKRNLKRNDNVHKPFIYQK